MSGFSVVILSRDAANLTPCVQAVLANEPALPRERVIVVDDGVRADAEPLLPGVRWIAGVEPFIFARNANLGIEAAKGDVILLNDDALLFTRGGFTALAAAAAGSPEYGAVSAVTNIAGNPAQQPQGVGMRTEPHVAFVCVWIGRRTWERCGALDERYCLDYGVEDRDYCHRINQAGLQVGIYDFCFVDHACLRSSFRGQPAETRSFARNWALFCEKWGTA
jgi:GT2 family glycosyltransferase